MDEIATKEASLKTNEESTRAEVHASKHECTHAQSPCTNPRPEERDAPMGGNGRLAEPCNGVWGKDAMRWRTTTRPPCWTWTCHAGDLDRTIGSSTCCSDKSHLNNSSFPLDLQPVACDRLVDRRDGIGMRCI